MGAPGKLTPLFIDEVVALLRQGNTLEDAVQSKGLAPRTLARWASRARERPGSIYGEFRARVAQAQAEASTIDVAILTRAATAPSVTRKTVTKRELVVAGDERRLEVTEETVTTVEKPPDPRWAAWKLERRNPAFRPKQEVEATVATIPPDMLGRSMGELLRLAQGGEGASLLREDDEEARQLVEARGQGPRR